MSERNYAVISEGPGGPSVIVAYHATREAAQADCRRLQGAYQGSIRYRYRVVVIEEMDDDV